MINSFAKALTYYPVVKTKTNISGAETLTTGTGVALSAALFRKEDAWSQGKEGLFDGADVIVMSLPTYILAKDAIVSYDGESFRLKSAILRTLGTTEFYYQARGFLI